MGNVCNLGINVVNIQQCQTQTTTYNNGMINQQNITQTQTRVNAQRNPF